MRIDRNCVMLAVDRAIMADRVTCYIRGELRLYIVQSGGHANVTNKKDDMIKRVSLVWRASANEAKSWGFLVCRSEAAAVRMKENAIYGLPNKLVYLHAGILYVFFLLFSFSSSHPTNIFLPFLFCFPCTVNEAGVHRSAYGANNGLLK